MDSRQLRRDSNDVEIRSESESELNAYAAIPASFEVTAVVAVERQGDRFSLSERPITQPYIKDYDAVLANSPGAWKGRFQLAEWGFFSAGLEGRWVGAAAVAPDATLAPGAEQGSAVLWDLRVDPGQRGRGIGSALFLTVEHWARSRNLRSLLAETQHNNVAACRLYQSCGCVLELVDANAYHDFPDELQLVWRKHLAPSG
jgi:ribosomal protein S18 acetylase RimI-like enzyme